MLRESLIGVRTMRDAGKSLDRARFGPKAPGLLSRLRPWQATQAAANLSSAEEEKIRRSLLLEEQRFRKQQARVEASQRRMLGVRSKLGKITRKNERFMDLRCRLQRELWAREQPADVAPSAMPPIAQSPSADAGVESAVPEPPNAARPQANQESRIANHGALADIPETYAPRAEVADEQSIAQSPSVEEPIKKPQEKKSDTKARVTKRRTDTRKKGKAR